MKLNQVLASAAVLGGLTAGAIGVASTASAQPGWTPPPAPPAGPNVGQAPAGAPPKPVDPLWANGQPQVWDEGWQHWGVWLNGVFVPTY
ncbi:MULTISPECIES: hypothetical protein [Mycolicibacterium]|uniref:Uncharacterized protein n=1 Tax=Mycolicibacterium gilvum TaxID=1804 RepID=A0A378SMI7_9MYCO|nr:MULTISPECIES: hypothetical protein [Mycolicibacterium]MBV5243666.1 hypothetical protein [Mycolicibacterium sp. PAM1]MCV7056776.1 hypothetical protein [Mycolicibacterium gilvum]STZ43923.1 Uncharacterised protein [Mycolicibacterium gilvum]